MLRNLQDTYSNICIPDYSETACQFCYPLNDPNANCVGCNCGCAVTPQMVIV